MTPKLPARTPAAKTLECSLCGATFRCERGPGCWCGSVKASRDALQLIRAGAEDCVCPSCLAGPS